MSARPKTQADEQTHPMGHETHLERTDLFPLPVQASSSAPSYYDIPLLKKPVWSWEIGAYFFLGGVSAGSYLLARMADRFGSKRYLPVTRAGTAIAVAALLPCPPLLIADLGDPKRFHHMLRVFKPRSPMNLGSWVLTAYSGVLSVTTARELLRWWQPNRREGRMIRIPLAVLDLLGLPLAMFFCSYTGVLLSGTSTPVWTKNRWLGPLFAAGAIGAAISATSIAVADPEPERDSSLAATLGRISTAVHAAEGVAVAGYIAEAGSLARPLTEGQTAPLFWGAIGGMVAAEVVRQLPVGSQARRWTGLAAAALDLASGFCLKWSIFRAGTPSAENPDDNRLASRPRDES